MKRFLLDIYLRLFIRLKYRKGFRACDKTLALGREMMSDRNRGMTWDHANHFSKVIIFVLAQNIHRLQSIRVLASQGLAKDAIPLIRCIFEDFAYVQYMFLHKETVRDFIDYGTYLQLQSGRGLLESNASFDRRVIEAKVQSLEQEWDQMKSRFLRSDGKVHKSWNKKNLAETSRDVGLEESYKTSYRYFSGFVHLNALSVNNYVEGMTDDGMVSVSVGASEAMVDAALHVGSATFVGLLGVANEEHTMGYEKELAAMERLLQKTPEKVPASSVK